MGKRVLSFANAFVTPGGVLAIIVGWVATRPDVQLRLEQLWDKLFGHEVSAAQSTHGATHGYEPYGANVTALHVNVPVSKSRCKVTQAFRPIRLPMTQVA